MTRLWFSSALLPTGWAENVRVTLSGMGIARVETGVAPAPDDDRHGPAFPGLCNLHSRAVQRGMAGLAETKGPGDDDIRSWRETMYRFVHDLDPDQVEAIAAYAFAEMVEAGFTRVGEFHDLHHAPDGTPYDNVAELAGRITEASAEAGIGLTLLPVFEAHGTFGGAAAGPHQARFLNDLDRFARIVEGCHDAIEGLDGAFVGTAPHSLRAASVQDIRAVAELAVGGPIHIQAAGQAREVADCQAHLGARPVEYLLDHLGVDHRWCLIHATHMSDAETADLALSGAVAGLCPVTEANLGGGIFPAYDYLFAGGRFGIGTGTNTLISAADELKGLEYSQRLAHGVRNVLSPPGRSTGRELYAAALKGGSQALGVAAGAIGPGAPADIVALDGDHPTLALAKGDAILNAWIFAGAPIASVWRGGRRIVRDGRHVAKERLGERYRQALRRLTT